MHFKIQYKDSEGCAHVRYYRALDPLTAQEMFKETVSHSIHEAVQILNIYKIENQRWRRLEKQ